eukprot:8812170-Pyramimonas_sp.AAC.1
MTTSKAQDSPKMTEEGPKTPPRENTQKKQHASDVFRCPKKLKDGPQSGYPRQTPKGPWMPPGPTRPQDGPKTPT